MTTVLASAADERYGFHLLSLVGSVQRNSDVFDRIVVHDLGLSPLQRRLAESIRGVEVREVPPFVPHWAQGFTWKPWIWTHLEFEQLLYIDAGATVLRPLDEPLRQISADGYFVVAQGFPARRYIPSDYYALYGLEPAAAERVGVAAGIVGFARGSRFWHEVVVPTYEDCVAGRSLGFSAQEVEAQNFGLGRTQAVVIRDAELFRWDQTILNLHFLRAFPEARINDLDEFAGWRSANDHPRQLIWSHRRGGDYRYLAAARYPLRERLVAARALARLRYGRWRRRNARFFQPGAYVRRLRRLVSGAR